MSKETENTVSYKVAASQADDVEEAKIEKTSLSKAEVEPQRKPAPAEDPRVKNIKTWIGIALLVIPLIVILLNTFVKKDDQDTARKIDAVSGALYKIMQVIANNPNAIAITGVAGEEGQEDVLSNFEFPQFNARNHSAA